MSVDKSEVVHSISLRKSMRVQGTLSTYSSDKGWAGRGDTMFIWFFLCLGR
jgi:hypothetical protein